MLSPRRLLAGLPGLGARSRRPPWRSRPTRCRPGTTARPSRRSSTWSAPPPSRQPRLRGARGPARHLRPGRHALGRAPDLQPGGVRARPGRGAGARASRVEGEGAVQDRALRRPRGDGQALLARPRGDRVRDPCRDDGRGVQRDRGGLGRQGQGPSLAPALHRAGLPADAGGAEPAARQRLPHLHRHRRRPGFRALLRRARLRRCPGRGDRLGAGDQLPLRRRGPGRADPRAEAAS